jgi:cephalosporin hydroxylase
MKKIYIYIRNLIEKFKYRRAHKITTNLVGQSAVKSAASIRESSIQDFWASVVVGADAPHYHLRWKDLEMTKFPIDIYIYQQLIWEANPEVIVEIGTQRGTSAEFFNELVKSANKPDRFVITVDINPVPEPQKTTLESLGVVVITGNISEKSIQEKISKYLGNKSFLLVDDGSHSYEDVASSLEFFEKFQSAGSYMVIEDGITDVMLSRSTRNALHAVDDFLLKNSNYTRVEEYDRWLFTTTFGGILKRI